MPVWLLSILTGIYVSFFGFIPPLGDDVRSHLHDTVIDGQPFEASIALDIMMMHVDVWEFADVDDVEFPEANWRTIESDPAQFRGDPFVMRGTLQRRDIAPLGRSSWEAWVLSDVDEPGQLAVLLLPIDSLEISDQSAEPFQAGQTVSTLTRFYGMIEVPSERPGQLMHLPLFVGAFPQSWAAPKPASAATNSPSSAVFIMMVVLALSAFVALRVFIWKGKRRASALPTWLHYDDDDANNVDEDTENLPEEPADALQVLSTRAGIRVADED